MKRLFWILALVFVLLLGGAYLLYERLGAQVGAPQLALQQTEEVIEEEAVLETAPGEESAGEAAEEAPAEEPAEETPAEETSAQEELPVAPDFTVYDREGNPVTLTDFRGKPVVLNFWASWCGPCKSEMADFDAAFAQYGEEIHFLMVNRTDGARETVETASAYVEENGFSFPVYYDSDDDAAAAYGVYAIPTTFFIDAEGYGVAYGSGAMNLETLERGIDLLLPEES